MCTHGACSARGFDSALLASCFIACRAKSTLRVATILLGFGRRGSRAGLAVRRLRLNSESDAFYGRRLHAGGIAVGSLEAGPVCARCPFNLVDENGEEGAEGMDVACQRGLVLIGVMAVGERVSASFVVVSDQVAWTVNGRCFAFGIDSLAFDPSFVVAGFFRIDRRWPLRNGSCDKVSTKLVVADQL